MTPELLAALEKAIAAYQEVQKKKEAREKEIARLQAIVDANPGACLIPHACVDHVGERDRRREGHGGQEPD